MAESRDGTTVPAYSFITDSEGALWGLAPSVGDGMQVTRNATLAGFTANVQRLVYQNHTVFQTNGEGWWAWGGNAWANASDPGSGGGTPPGGGGGGSGGGGGGGSGGGGGGNYAAVLDAPSGGDDTDMINAKLFNVGSGVVHAPGGNTWLHNSPIRIPGDVTLQGDGDSSVFHATATGTDPDMAIRLEGTGACLADVMLTTDYPTGQGLQPGDDNGSGHRSSQPDSHLVYIAKDCNSFTVRGVHGIGGASGGIYSGGARGGLIDECIIEYALADAIGLYEATSDTTVQNCIVRGCGDDAIAIVPYDNTGQGSGIVIQNNNVSGGYWGRGITDVGSDRAIIRNNTASDYYASGIMVDHDTGAGTTAPSNGTLEGNTVINCPNRASGYAGSYFIYRDASNYTVTGNKAENIPAGCEAIVVDSSSSVNQSGNSWN